jgi:hypothetical protein
VARVLRGRAGADDAVRARELPEAARARNEELAISGLLSGIDALWAP